MVVEGADGDLNVALDAAVKVTARSFGDVAGCTAAGAVAAAEQVTQVADVFVAWLRRVTSLSLTLVSIEEQDTGEPVADPLPRGEDMAVTLDTSQQARFDINARDDRGFLSKSVLDLTVTGPNITGSVEDTPDPNTPNQLVVVAVQPGAGGLVVLSVPDNDTIPDASEAFDVVAGGVATLALGTPVIEEQPTPPPVEEPPAPPAP